MKRVAWSSDQCFYLHPWGFCIQLGFKLWTRYTLSTNVPNLFKVWWTHYKTAPTRNMISFAVKSSVQCSPTVLARHSPFQPSSLHSLENRRHNWKTHSLSTSASYYVYMLNVVAQKIKLICPVLHSKVIVLTIPKEETSWNPEKKKAHLSIKENCVSKVMVTLHMK